MYRELLKYSSKSLIIVILLFMIHRIYINDIDKDLIYGSDKFMTNLNRNCYCCGRSEMNENYDSEKIWNLSKKNIQNYINKNNDIFMYYDLKEKKYKINLDLTIDDICIETDKSFDEYTNDENIHKNMGFFVVFNRKKNIIEFVINHTVYDFVKAGKFMSLLYYKPFQSVHDVAPFYKYKPLVNEFIMLSTYINYISYFTEKTYKFNKFEIVKNRFIRKIYCSDLYNNSNFKKSEINLALSLYHIFKSLTVKIDFFNIAYLIGLKNNRFRNNYTCILLKIPFSLNFKNIIINVKKEITKNKFYVFGIYDILNYSININLQTNLKEKIHLQFTNIYTKNENLGKFVNCNYIILNKPSTPFYVTSSYTNNKNCICIQYSTPDIDIKKLNSPLEHFDV